MSDKNYISIPTRLSTGEWTYTPFTTRDDMKEFVKGLFKEPGLYQFDQTATFFNEQARIFQERGVYCDIPEGSMDYQNYWDTEKEKCRKGCIYHGKNGEIWYLPRFYYHWLNFLQIYDKRPDVKKFIFAEVRDVQYHMALYTTLAQLHDKNVAILKSRQKASSYFHIAELYNRYIFEEGYVGKIGASDKKYISKTKGSWKFLNQYHNFTNKYTAWSCTNMPDREFEWEQKVETKSSDGVKIQIGTMATITGVSFDKDPVSGVGGATDFFFYEEGGIAPTADITYGYIMEAMREGAITTGLFSIAGSVGALDQCGPLRKFIEYPEANDFYPVITNLLDEHGTIGTTGLFIPEQWGMVPYIDQYGNSMVKEAKQYLDDEYTRIKKEKGAEDYQLRVSQRPRNIKEAFAIRTVSRFPVKHTTAQIARIEAGDYHIRYVDLDYDEKGDVIEKRTEKTPIMEFPLSMTTVDKTGVICIHEPPVRDSTGHVPWLTYYASVDPVEKGRSEYVENRIFTSTGRKRIGDIRVGDDVIGADGLSTRVKGVFPQGVRKLYKVTFNDKTSVVVDKDHLWNVELNGGTRGSITLSTGDLLHKKKEIVLKGTGFNKRKEYRLKTHYKRSDGANRWKIPMVEPIQFKNKNELPIDPYFLGLLIGDGTFCNNYLGFAGIDTEIIKYIQSILEKDFTIKNDGKECSWRIGRTGRENSKKGHYIKDALRQIGLNGHKSHTKFIPDIYKYSSIENRLAIIQGLMDTDGYNGKTGSMFYTVSEKLSQDITEIVQSLGGVTMIRTKVTNWTYKGIKKQGNVFVVLIKLPSHFNPFRLARKANNYIPAKKYPPARYICDIQYERRAEAVCISVENEDNLYITENAIVTHNTVTSDSLFSIYVYKNPVEVTKIDANGESTMHVEGDKLVCWWTGRFDDLTDTNERAWKIVQYYNAWTLSENQKTSFINYVISKKGSRHLVPKDDILFDKELENKQNTYDTYGWSKSTRLWEIMMEYGVSYLSEVLDEGKLIEVNGHRMDIIYGVTRIPDIMLLREMQQYQDKGNYDRIIAYTALIAFARKQQAERGVKKIVRKDDQAKKTEKVYTFERGLSLKTIGRGATPKSFNRGKIFKSIR